MKAYGVPKLFGNNTDGSKNGVSAAPSGNAPSANMGIGNINNVAGNNFGVGGTYNQFQVIYLTFSYIAFFIIYCFYYRLNRKNTKVIILSNDLSYFHIYICNVSLYFLAC